MSRTTEFKKKVKEKNEAAQLESASGNLASITQILSRTAIELQGQQELLSIAKRDLIKVSNELEEAKTELRSIASAHIIGKQALFDCKKEFSSLSDEVSKLKATKEELDNGIKNAKALALKLALEQKTGLEGEINRLELEAKEKQEHMDGLSVVFKQIEANLKSQLDLIKLELDSTRESVSAERKILDAVKEEVSEANKKLEAERKKIELPLIALKSEQAKLERTRKDLEIYDRRIRARFRQMFPDSSMSI